MDTEARTQDNISQHKYLRQFGINKCPVCRLDFKGDTPERCPYCGTMLRI